jgi:hypothetical protein
MEDDMNMVSMKIETTDGSAITAESAVVATITGPVDAVFQLLEDVIGATELRGGFVAKATTEDLDGRITDLLDEEE